MLQAKAAIPRRPAGTWDAKWGYGLISAKGL